MGILDERDHGVGRYIPRDKMGRGYLRSGNMCLLSTYHLRIPYKIRVPSGKVPVLSETYLPMLLIKLMIEI